MQSGRSAAPVVAIAGATGAVGIELLGCLERRNFPLSELRLFASARSAGKTLPFRGQSVPVQELTEKGLEGVNIGLFSAGGSTSRKFAPVAVSKGAVVVDNSSAFRMNADVPLVVPEINPGAIREHRGIIANPNCAAIISITPLWPIHRANRIRRRHVRIIDESARHAALRIRDDRWRDLAALHQDGRRRCGRCRSCDDAERLGLAPSATAKRQQHAQHPPAVGARSDIRAPSHRSLPLAFLELCPGSARFAAHAQYFF